MDNAGVPNIFDKNRRNLRYQRAMRLLSQRSDAARWLGDDMADDIADRIDFMQLPSGSAYIAGDLGKGFGTALSARGIKASEGGPNSLDEEQPWPVTGFDYVFSIRTLSTLNDLPGALLHARNAINGGGLYMAQILGAGSLPTLRKIMLAADGDSPAARIHPQIDNRSASALLQRAGFAKQVVDSRSLTVRFSSFERMIGDLREQALTGILSDRPPSLTRASLQRAKAAFDDLREDDGKVTETFEILALTGWL